MASSSQFCCSICLICYRCWQWVLSTATGARNGTIMVNYCGSMAKKWDSWSLSSMHSWESPRGLLTSYLHVLERAQVNHGEQSPGLKTTYGEIKYPSSQEVEAKEECTAAKESCAEEGSAAFESILLSQYKMVKWEGRLRWMCSHR